MNNYDYIIDLPTDKNQPTYEEIRIINSIFKNTEPESNTFNDILSKFPGYLIVSSLIFASIITPNIFRINLFGFNIIKALLAGLIIELIITYANII